MYKKIISIIFLLSIISCQKKTEKDLQFLTQEFATQFSTLFPDETPLKADNVLLTQLHIPSDSVLKQVYKFQKHFNAELSGFDAQTLTPSVANDFKKMNSLLQNVQKYIQTYKQNPLNFNVLYGFDRVFKTNYASITERAQTIFTKLEHVPAFYENAKKQLKTSSPKLIEQAVEQQLKTYIFFDKTLPDFLIQNQSMTPQFQARIDAAKLAIKDYVAYVESLKLQ